MLLAGARGWAAWPPVLAVWGPGGKSARHAHHAMHVILARQGALRIGARRTAGVLTAPDVAHEVDATAQDVLIVFVEPESDAGERLSHVARAAGGVRSIDAAERDALLALEPTALVARLHGERLPPRRMHPRVRRVIRHLDASAAATDTSLDALAAIASLSPGRLVHAFTESTGISLRAFLLWRKVQRAALAMAKHAALSVAAHEAGFADAAHMSRTFRRTFGVTPSELRRTLRPS